MNLRFIALLVMIPLLVALGAPKATAQEKKINWMSMEQAEQMVKANPKKIFVDLYTDWCGWCKRMDANTFTHPVIVDYINENFYAVKLDAEQDEPITFRGQKYVNENPENTRSAHSLAIAILQGRMGYPSVAFFDEDLNLIHALSGYRPPEGLEPILVFFNDEVYKENPNLDQFIQDFQGKVQE